MNDIIPRIGNPSPAVIERIIRTLLSTLCSLVSTNKIRNTLKSQNVTLSHGSLDNYLQALTDSLLFFRVPRFDVKGRELLQRLEKYYTVDLGFRHLLLPDHTEDFGHILENIVYLELRRRFPKVYVGNAGQFEVDFVVVTEENSFEYYQVSETTLDQNTLRRELRALEKNDDQYLKYLLTMDTLNPTAK